MAGKNTFAFALLATAGLFVANAASAQTQLPPPDNVNPGSPNSDAEDSGAEDQPRSDEGTTGSGIYSPAPVDEERFRGERLREGPGTMEREYESEPVQPPRGSTREEER